MPPTAAALPAPGHQVDRSGRWQRDSASPLLVRPPGGLQQFPVQGAAHQLDRVQERLAAHPRRLTCRIPVRG